MPSHKIWLSGSGIVEGVCSCGSLKDLFINNDNNNINSFLCALYLFDHFNFFKRMYIVLITVDILALLFLRVKFG